MTIGALEAGGTKMVLAAYDEAGRELDRLSLPTETPDVTMPRMIDYFRAQGVSALGIGSFGPLDLEERSPGYGDITATPKLAWRNYPLLRAFRDALGVPCAIDTDVNAAALAEVRQGAARGLDSCVYVTVGTGIGGGVYAGGALVHGLMHPEIGHMLLRPHPDDPNPRGVCPYHDGCLEGLASGPAVAARCGGDARALPDDDPAWALEAHYLAQMCVNLIVTLSPERILLGGGVMQRACLYPLIRRETLRLLGGYVQRPEILTGLDEYIVPPALYPISGLIGAYLLGWGAAPTSRQGD